MLNNTKKIKIKNVNDFNKLRNNFKEENIAIYIRNDIDFTYDEFKPIDLSDKNVYVYGNGYFLSNLRVNSKEYAGLFSKVKNLYVRKLKFDNAEINGEVYAGILAGCVGEDTNIELSDFYGKVNAKAYAGGVAGYSSNINSSCNMFVTNVDGYDVVGGVVGYCNSFTDKDSQIYTKVCGKLKAVGSTYGYNNEIEKNEINDMLIEALRHLPVECSYEEMKILELTMKNNRH